MSHGRLFQNPEMMRPTVTGRAEDYQDEPHTLGIFLTPHSLFEHMLTKTIVYPLRAHIVCENCFPEPKIDGDAHAPSGKVTSARKTGIHRLESSC